MALGVDEATAEKMSYSEFLAYYAEPGQIPVFLTASQETQQAIEEKMFGKVNRDAELSLNGWNQLVSGARIAIGL